MIETGFYFALGVFLFIIALMLVTALLTGGIAVLVWIFQLVGKFDAWLIKKTTCAPKPEKPPSETGLGRLAYAAGKRWAQWRYSR